MLTYDSKLVGLSRSFRKHMTNAEKHLWSKLRKRQINNCQFYRQRILGNYIVDFYCSRAKLVIEVDGSQHVSDDMAEADSERDEYLKNLGLKVLRFNDIDVLRNIEGVVENILENMMILR